LVIEPKEIGHFLPGKSNLITVTPKSEFDQTGVSWKAAELDLHCGVQKSIEFLMRIFAIPHPTLGKQYQAVV